MRKVGRCKICAWDRAKELNRRVAQGGWNAAEAAAWSEPKGLTFDRKTFYAHKEHSQHPADALVSHAENAAAKAHPTVTQTAFYEAIRDVGFRNAMSDPSSVTLTHALKAADALERRKDQGADLLATLAKLMMGAPMQQVVVIEGEAQEITPIA